MPLTKISILYFFLTLVATPTPAQTPSFQGRHDYKVEGGFAGVSVYDCNADGIPDLSDWGQEAGIVQVLQGVGDGTFRTGPVSHSIVTPVSVQRVADFNNDGKPDIVQIGYNPKGTEQGVGVLQGGNDCSFPTGGSFKSLTNTRGSHGYVSYEMAVGDFNGDGNMDVVVVLYAPHSPVNYYAWVFLPGDGKGNFGTPILTNAGNLLQSGQTGSGIVVGDFNQDGHLDMAVPSASGITIWYGLGNGKFHSSPATINISGLDYNQMMQAVDINGDGYLDLVASASTNGGEMVIVPGGRHGRFGSPTFVPGFEGQMAVVDMNGDHILDIVAAVGNGINEQGTGVALGNGDGTFSAPSQWASVGGPVYVADLRKIGVMDIVADGEEAISVLLNNGNVTFPDTPGIADPSGGDPTCVAVADFNRDGIQDAAFMDTIGTLSVLFGTGNPGAPFRLGPTRPNTGSSCLVAGDFNNDGIPDVAITAGTPFAGTYQVLLGVGDGTFIPQTPLAILGGAKLCSGDFNGDGNLDLVNGYGVVAFGKGDGTFNPPLNLPVGTADGTTYRATGDLNKDGITDVVLSSQGHNSLFIYLGNRAGTFSPVATYASFNNFPITVADLNGDGILDVVGSRGFGSVQVFLGTGDGGLVPQLEFNAPAEIGPIQIAVADFNGDGKLDLAIVNQDASYGGYVSMLTGNGDGTFVDAGLAAVWLPVDAIAPMYLQGQKPGAPYDFVEAGGSHFAWLLNNTK